MKNETEGIAFKEGSLLMFKISGRRQGYHIKHYKKKNQGKTIIKLKLKKLLLMT